MVPEVLLSRKRDRTSKSAQCENARHWKYNLILQQAVFEFENNLELFIVDDEIGRRLHFERLNKFKDACIASNLTQHFDLQQQVSFISNLLQSFKARFGEFRERTCL